MRLPLIPLVACLSLCLATLPSAHAEDLPTPLETAEADLEMLDDLLDDRDALMDDITTYVRVVGDQMLSLEAPADDLEDFRKDASDAMLEALRESEYKNHRNLREPVNIQAAMVLSRTAPVLSERRRKRIEKKIRRTIDRLSDADIEPTQGRLDVTFQALANIGDLDTLRWLLDEYSHTRKREAPFLIAAHQAMLQFDNAPGKLRHEIVETFIKRYAGVESLANTSTTDKDALAKKRFWDNIRIHTVAVVQHFAGHPTNANGALNTMGDFQHWFREVKRPSDAPWKDEKPTE